MNDRHKRLSLRRVVATVAAIAFSTAMAATAIAMPWGGGNEGKGGGRFESRMEHGMKEMSRLHDDLKLDAKQEALWKEAERAGKESMAAMRDRFRQRRDELQTMIDKPGADLRAVAKRMDEFKAEGLKLHEANRDRWLTVYDALNAEQKEKARLFFKSKLDRMANHGHGGHHGQPGQPGQPGQRGSSGSERG